jgi:hypothetical protein
MIAFAFMGSFRLGYSIYCSPDRVADLVEASELRSGNTRIADSTVSKARELFVKVRIVRSSTDEDRTIGIYLQFSIAGHSFAMSTPVLFPLSIFKHRHAPASRRFLPTRLRDGQPSAALLLQHQLHPFCRFSPMRHRAVRLQCSHVEG